MPKMRLESGSNVSFSVSALGKIPLHLAIGQLVHGYGFFLTLLWLTVSFQMTPGLGNGLEFNGFVCLDEVLTDD